jgi:hypothetical protein
MLTRRDWLLRFGALVPAATWIACKHDGSSTPPDAAPPDGPSGLFQTNIMDNHAHAPHSLVVPIQDAYDAIATNSSRTYHIQGMANHDHTVTYTVDDFKNLLQQHMEADEPSTVAICHMHVCALYPPA